MSNAFQSSFKVSQSHIQGCTFDIASSQKFLYSIGTDDVICSYSLNNQPSINTISNPNSHQLTKLAYNSNKNIFAVGTQSGVVLQLKNNQNNFSVDSSQILYKSLLDSDNNKVKSLTFTQDGNFLIIATNQPYCILYEWKYKRFFKHRIQSDTQIASITADYRNLFFSVIDYDGKVTVYQIVDQQEPQKMEVQGNSDSQDPFVELNAFYKTKTLRIIKSLKITKPNSNIFKKNYYITASFNYNQTFLEQALYLPGQTTLQKIDINLPPACISAQYKICSKIFHLTEIHQVVWLNHEKGGLILTGTQIENTLWHQNKGQKLMIFNCQAVFGEGRMIKNICVRKYSQSNNWGFAVIAISIKQQDYIPCKVYDFKAFEQLEYQINKIQQSNELIQQRNQQSQLLNLQSNTRNKTTKNPFKPIQQESVAAKLITSYLQLSLSTAYERGQDDNARFLYYNNVGCIIQRFDAQNSSFIQLQFHNKSIRSAIKIPPEHVIQYFSLCSDTLIYASNNKFYLQSQKQLKANYQWEYEWQQIQGITIGGDWVCAANKGQIKVWDWVGNQLHSVAFDRKFVAMAAYEDLLAIIYHSSLPMWGVQSYKMLIFEVTSKSMKCIKDVIIPCKQNVALKWFGFSQEGMLFCNDQSQTLRAYMFERDEWIETLAWDPTIERLFIQNIQEKVIYGFRLDQKFPCQPRVMPRSYPKKIPFELSSFKIDYLSKQQNDYIVNHKLQLMWLQHQKFRSSRWYKHKYSRNSEHRWYKRTENIKSEQQIKAQQARLDLRLMDYLKKYVKLHRNEKSENQKKWKQVLLLCSCLTYYQQTRNKLSEILSESDINSKPKRQSLMFSCPQQNPQIHNEKIKGISQLDRLQQMMGLTWLNLQQRLQRMQIQ